MRSTGTYKRYKKYIQELLLLCVTMNVGPNDMFEVT